MNIQESAMLAGYSKSYKHSPILHPEAAKTRRAIVLNAMVDFGKLSQDEANKLKETPIEITEKTTTKKEYRFQSFIDYVVEEALEKLELEGSETRKLYTAGYKIYTTLDQNIQNKMEEIYEDPKKFPPALKKINYPISYGSAGPPYRRSKGLMGGRNQEGKRNFNRATRAYVNPALF